MGRVVERDVQDTSPLELLAIGGVATVFPEEVREFFGGDRVDGIAKEVLGLWGECILESGDINFECFLDSLRRNGFVGDEDSFLAGLAAGVFIVDMPGLDKDLYVSVVKAFRDREILEAGDELSEVLRAGSGGDPGRALAPLVFALARYGQVLHEELGGAGVVRFGAVIRKLIITLSIALSKLEFQ